MTDAAGPSTPSSRKRTKWEVTAEENRPSQNEHSLIKKRPKGKNIRVHEPEQQPRLPNNAPQPATKSVLSHSKYVPPRTRHPPLLSSRSVYSYERLNQIEEGSYGVVFRARDKQTGEIVALKKLKLDEEKYGFPITALREINALIACRHDNVVGIREIVVGETLTQCVRRRLVSYRNKRASHRFEHWHRLPG